ncbi:MAG: hypothetical protein QW587_04905 [Candidatus Bathyarchaeia archaeon]
MAVQVSWAAVRRLNLPTVRPERGGWLAREQVIDLPHMRIRLNPPAPPLHGLRVGRLGDRLCLFDAEGCLGLVVAQTVRMRRAQARSLGLL